MSVDGLMGRAATGLATIALLGVGAHLLGAGPHPAQSQDGARGTVPDAAVGNHFDHFDLRGQAQPPAVWLTDAADAGPAVAAVPQSPIEAFSAASVDVAAAPVGSPMTNSLGSMFMSLGIMAPLSMASKVVQEFSPALDAPGLDAPVLDAPGLDAPVLDAVGVDAVPADALLAF